MSAKRDCPTSPVARGMNIVQTKAPVRLQNRKGVGNHPFALTLEQGDRGRFCDEFGGERGLAIRVHIEH